MLRYDSKYMFFPQIKDKAIKKEDLFDFKKDNFKDSLTFRKLIYNETSKIKEIGDKIKSKFSTYVVVGIGGSDLGSRTIESALCSKEGGLKVKFIGENTDPDEIANFFKGIDIKSTIFNVISKSGETVEIIANFLYIKNVIYSALGNEGVSSNIVITTSSPGSTLYKLSQEYGIEVIEGVSYVGDRFSVLSVIGLLTAYVLGLDIDKFLEGAKNIDNKTNSVNPNENEALMFAELNYLSFKNLGKNIAILMPYSQNLRNLGFWYRQLWAESLGKKLSISGDVVHFGLTPIASVGSTDQHSQIQLYNEGPNDKIITFIEADKFKNDIEIKASDDLVSYLNGKTFSDIIHTERLATSVSLMENGRSNGTLHIDEISEFSLGELFYFFELAVSYIGEFANINTFDQPGVEKGKEYMYSMLLKPGFEEQKKHLDKIINENT